MNQTITKNENQIRVLLVALDCIEKHILTLNDPFGNELNNYAYAMNIMKKIISKLNGYLPSKYKKDDYIIASIDKNIENL